jgi:hypothetical protein
MNTITYVRNFKTIKKSYDYIILTFPLTKSIKKENFWLEILYRDFLDYELNHLNMFIVKGKLKKRLFSSSFASKEMVKLYSNDSTSHIKSIKANLPVKSRHATNEKVLYSVVLSNEASKSYTNYLDKLFKKKYRLIKKFMTSNVPLYKKVKYTHTPFPEIVIDGRRNRVFYLNGMEWLDSSKESNCISARNISYLIAKRELNKSSYREITKSNSKKFNSIYIFENMAYLAIFSGLFFWCIIRNNRIEAKL